MKKIVAILAIIVSAGAFAQTMDYTADQNMGNKGQHQNHRGMMQQIENLTPEQQDEFNALHTKQIKEKQRLMLDIKEVNLKIQREMTAEKPNQKNLDKLIDQKARLKAQNQKDMLKFRLDMKEKFDIQMGGPMNSGNKCGKMDSKGMRNKNGMMMMRPVSA